MRRNPGLLKPGFIGGAIKRNLKGQFVKGSNGRIGTFMISDSKLDDIKKLYYQEEQSLSRIAKDLNCNLETLRQFFLHHGLKRKTPAEGTRLIANDPDLRKKRSENMTGIRNHRFGKKAAYGTGFGRVGIRKDLNQYFRSSWEANIARLLNYYQIPWQYETQTFVLREISYTPDFLIKDDIYLEVKGKYLKNAEEKIKRFREFYPDKKYILIDSKLYRQLERVYHRVIPKWEYR